MANKETQTPSAPTTAAAPLDYRAHYATSLPQPSFSAPAYPIPARNPTWTLGRILFATAGTAAALGALYWAFTAVKKSKAKANPVRQLHVAPEAGVAPLQRVA